jgi:pimeloyl-ACP methyl ester carboxylesterase
MMSVVLLDSDAGLRDLRDYARGVADSQKHFREAVEATDLPAIGTDFAIPFFVFQGAIDRMTPVEPVRAYVDSITAPRKRLVLITNAGHNAMVTKSDEFLSLLVQLARPLAIQSP